MTVPYTVILLEETKDGPDFFREVVRHADLNVTSGIAVQEAFDRFDTQEPRVRLVGILRGSFGENWTPASRLRAQ